MDISWFFSIWMEKKLKFCSFFFFFYNFNQSNQCACHIGKINYVMSFSYIIGFFTSFLSGNFFLSLSLFLLLLKFPINIFFGFILNILVEKKIYKIHTQKHNWQFLNRSLFFYDEKPKQNKTKKRNFQFVSLLDVIFQKKNHKQSKI